MGDVYLAEDFCCQVNEMQWRSAEHMASEMAERKWSLIQIPGMSLQSPAVQRGRQAETLLFCDGQHWKLVTSHNGKNSPPLLADLHLYNILGAYSSRRKAGSAVQQIIPASTMQ